MPTSTRRTENVRGKMPARRAIVAVSVPLAAAAVAGTLALDAPANAAGSSTVLPFATSVCGDSTTTTGGGSSSTKKSATPTPKASASKTPSAKASTAPSPSTSASPSASASSSGTADTTTNGTAATPSASTSSSSAGGFWGWLNGVWTWIFGADQLAPTTAAPAIDAGYVHSGVGTNAGAADAKSVSLLTAASASPSATASCVPSSEVKKNALAATTGDTAAESPWHLSTPSMTQYGLTYNGVTTIKTIDGGSIRAMDFTATKVTLVSMVTYSHQGGTKLQYVDGGANQTVTLTNVHLLTTELKGKLLGIVPVDFTPDNPPPLLVGVTTPIPLLFTDVEADNAFLNTDSIEIPGFNGHGN